MIEFYWLIFHFVMLLNTNLSSLSVDLQDSLIANLLRLIKKMRPEGLSSKGKKKKGKKKAAPTWDEREAEEEDKKSNNDINRQLFPALAMPDNPNVRVGSLFMFSNVRITLFHFAYDIYFVHIVGVNRLCVVETVRTVKNILDHWRIESIILYIWKNT
jgi:hypothetical protein